MSPGAHYPRSVSVANYYSSRDGQLVQASAVTLPAVRIQICNLASYFRGSFTRCVAVQRVMAPFVVVEILKAMQFVLQVVSSPKGYEVEVVNRL